MVVLLKLVPLVIGGLLSSWGGGVVYGDDVAADEFSHCRATTKSQRYLDSLYRCHPGQSLSVWLPVNSTHGHLVTRSSRHTVNSSQASIVQSYG